MTAQYEQDNMPQLPIDPPSEPALNPEEQPELEVPDSPEEVAKLLGHARELLQVCRALHNWFGKLRDWEGVLDPPIDELRVAIRKAEENIWLD